MALAWPETLSFCNDPPDRLLGLPRAEGPVLERLSQLFRNLGLLSLRLGEGRSALFFSSALYRLRGPVRSNVLWVSLNSQQLK